MNLIKENLKEIIRKAHSFNILNELKIDQIAIATKDSFKLLKLLTNLGLTEWTRDVVIAEGSVRGEESLTNCAILNFNYQMGIEFEVLEYTNGKSWHDELRKLEGDANFLSHIGYHLKDEIGEVESVRYADETKERKLMDRVVVKTAEEQLLEIKLNFLEAGYGIAQEVWTKEHNNAYLLEQKRKYHYIIFDTREQLGFDVKLIVRRENA